MNPLNTPVEHLEQRLQTLFPELPSEFDKAPSLQAPRDRNFGDLALACFSLAKFKKASPPQIAAELARSFDLCAEPGRPHAARSREAVPGQSGKLN